MSGARSTMLGLRAATRSIKVMLPASRATETSYSLSHNRQPQAKPSGSWTRSFSTESQPLGVAFPGFKRRHDSLLTTAAPSPPGFEVVGKVFAITGGGGGLGLVLASYLAKLGAHVYCLDRLSAPVSEYYQAQQQVGKCVGCGSLGYRRLDVRDAEHQELVFSEIAGLHGRLDGLVAAAAIQHVCPALEYPPEKITEMLDVNVKGVHLTATAAAKQMIKYNCTGSIVLVASMSGFISNRGLECSVYNASKAAVISLGRSFADQWSKAVNGKPIRVNSLCPGNIMTPMLRKNFADEPHLKKQWEDGNMLGRISEPEEFTGAVLFMLSNASSFMTGASLLVDAGYTAW